jgi:hypothetical protein
MAAWQVDLHVVPRHALATATHPLTPAIVDSTNWWQSHRSPADYQTRLAAVAAPGKSGEAALETWGEEQGNRVDVWSDGGRVKRIRVRVDVRRLDARFGAAVLGFVRAANAVMIRGDGVVLEPTIAAFAGALRSSAAWRYANDPAAFLSRAGLEDGE